jgi:hypothetical protein
LDNDLYIKWSEADVAKAAVVQSRQFVVLMLKLHVATGASGKKTDARNGQ